MLAPINRSLKTVRAVGASMLAALAGLVAGHSSTLSHRPRAFPALALAFRSLVAARSPPYLAMFLALIPRVPSLWYLLRLAPLALREPLELLVL